MSRIESRAILIAVWVALAGCLGPAPPRTAGNAEPSTGCPEISGSFVFQGLAEPACERRGSLYLLPAYPIQAEGRLRGPRDRLDFLPLPLAHWADPHSRIEVEQVGCLRLLLRLSNLGEPASPYLSYEVPLGELARQGQVQWVERGLSFAGDWRRSEWQIPLGWSRRRESWSLVLDERGRLDYSYSFVDAGALLWVVPMRSRLMIRCTLGRTEPDRQTDLGPSLLQPVTIGSSSSLNLPTPIPPGRPFSLRVAN